MEKSLCFGCMEYIESDSKRCQCGFVEDIYEAEPHHLKPGTILKERYQVGRVLGEGGFGITYVGRDIVLDMKVAIKEFYMSGYVNRNNTYSALVKASVGSHSELFETNREKFLTEARVLAKFSDEEGIVGIRDFFQENNTAYIVMNFLTGETLRSYLKTNGKIGWRETINIMTPIIKSLGIVHQHNVIHRDISPDNIMLTQDHKIKLLDFGAAREVSQTDMKSLSVILKPGYAPEEQYRSKGQQGPWTDIYALCATMYYCISGTVPDDSMERMFEDKLRPLCEVEPLCSVAVSNVIARGMAVRQKDRYQSIAELQADLDKAMANPNDASVSGSMPVTELISSLQPKVMKAAPIADDNATMYAGELGIVGKVAVTDDNATVYAEEIGAAVKNAETVVESNDEVPVHHIDTTDFLANNASADKKKKRSSLKTMLLRKKMLIGLGIMVSIIIFVVSFQLIVTYSHNHRNKAAELAENELWQNATTGSYVYVEKADGSKHVLTAGVELKYYLDQGWKIDGMPEFLAAGEKTRLLELQADAKTYYPVIVVNPYTSIAEIEDCIVSVMRFYTHNVPSDEKWYFFVEDGKKGIQKTASMDDLVKSIGNTDLSYEQSANGVFIFRYPSTRRSETRVYWNGGAEIEQISFNCEKDVIYYFRERR